MNSATSKSSFERLTRNSRSSSVKSVKIQKAPTPKKVIISKKLPNYGESTSYSAGVINRTKPVCKPRKTTKSDLSFSQNRTHNHMIDYCKNCGDIVKTQMKQPKVVETDEEIKTMIGMMNEKCVRNDNHVKTIRKQETVQQYYKNVNFQQSTDSVPDADNTKKASLDTIREVPEIYTEDSIYRLYSDSDEESSETSENIEEVKEFRRKNYFECHSATSRINTKPSAISLRDHKCVYRFYLNDRLFPVPLNADYNNRIRCVECHLPMDIKNEYVGKSINGTIQAKVKIGKGETRDMVLLLPVKDTLIIKERRKECRKVDDEVVYFGVIKLRADGNSLFNSTLPNDSLALKFQKGYKDFREDERYSYKNLEDDDVIVI